MIAIVTDYDETLGTADLVVCGEEPLELTDVPVIGFSYGLEGHRHQPLSAGLAGVLIRLPFWAGQFLMNGQVEISIRDTGKVFYAFLPGLLSMSQKLDVPRDAMSARWKRLSLAGYGDGKVEVKNDAGELLSIVSELLGLLRGFTEAAPYMSAAPGAPVTLNPAVAAPIQALLDSAESKLNQFIV